MRHHRPAVAAALTSLALATGSITGTITHATASPTAAVSTPSVPWMNTALSPSRRAALLLSAMTLDEKIAMVHGIGLPLAGAGAASVPANTRLGIPALALSDGPLGVGNSATGVTEWPDALNNAATWDPHLVKQYGTALGTEFIGKGRNVALTPTVNILRVPNWGRAFETFSEDPVLASAMGDAEIEGVQSKHVIATVKHFAANNQEVNRNGINVKVSDKALNEIYYPAFKSAVQKAGVGAVMCSYNRVNGHYACENAALLSRALKQAWGFVGFVMSDWGATHSTVTAANAGLDAEMPGGADGSSNFGSALKDAVSSGAVPMARLDDMVRRIFTAMFTIGLFDHPVPDASTRISTVVSTPQHQKLAAQLSEQGTVLLKDTHAVLPLTRAKSKRIAVIGYAGDLGAEYHGGGSAAVDATGTPVSPLAGITARAGSRSTVTYAKGPGGPLPVLTGAKLVGGTFTGSYYAAADGSGAPLAVQSDPAIDFGTGDFSYAFPVPGAKFARWTGQLAVPVSGDYHFSLDVTGVGRVWVNDQPVINVSTDIKRALAEGQIHLTAGQPASIRVEVTPFDLTQFGFPLVLAHANLGALTPSDPDPVAIAAQAATKADVAVVFASDLTSEGSDRTSLALPGDQDRLIQAVAKVNKHVVVVLNTSSAVLMPWLNKVDGVLEVWYPGQEYGTAVARVLFGDVNPSGKLPLTFPASNAQGPAGQGVNAYPGDATTVHYDEGMLVGYRWYDATAQKPLFPFGFGLSYTSFGFSRLKVHTHGYSATVTARITNTGQRTGSEVAQLYVSPPKAAGQGKQVLKAFRKVQLAPGRSTTVTFTLTAADLKAWSTGTQSWKSVAGNYGFRVGSSSTDQPLVTERTLPSR